MCRIKQISIFNHIVIVHADITFVRGIFYSVYLVCVVSVESFIFVIHEVCVPIREGVWLPHKINISFCRTHTRIQEI